MTRSHVFKRRNGGSRFGYKCKAEQKCAQQKRNEKQAERVFEMSREGRRGRYVCWITTLNTNSQMLALLFQIIVNSTKHGNCGKYILKKNVTKS